MGSLAEHQPDFRRATAARLHDARRPARPADRPPPARCAPGRHVTAASPDLPPVALVRQYDTHRLIPSQYSRGGDSVLVRIVDAAFTHAHPLGSRFNGPDRGAWYAAFELETAHAEIAFHKSTEYAEIGRFEDSVTYDDYRADLSAALHDVRSDPAFASCLDP